MSSTAIRVMSLGKQYQIGTNDPTSAFGNRKASMLASIQILPSRLFGHIGKKETIWALKDVTFDVGCHQVVGIIGRNGSGKSTLLKILSRITEPTEGRAELYGRTASLLEVGTGFHPDLTGRENIYVNGSILGMKKREIDAKFDEIVAFSEIEKFIDTPIKRYSSGMGVRLAFAVAAHLEPEILMVDEVLAVGDLKFQRKCMDKMKDEVRDGKTVLFVSHQMNAVRRLCKSCVWLDRGTVKMHGPTAEVVAAYESASYARMIPDEVDKGPSQFLSWEIVHAAHEEPNWLETFGPVEIKFVVRVKDELRNALHGVALWNANDDLVWGTSVQGLSLEPGINELVHALPSLPLKPGSYRWHVSLWDGAQVVDEWYAVPEMIIATEPLGHYSDQWGGVLNIPCHFEVNHIR
jgi:lipopolysaccharide transport system ATP-binding protein